MFYKSTWLHLRIPFSFFLLPVFLFALAISPNINESRILIVFISLHLFLYPASNGYNSYFDKDSKSIGGLKNPPKVTRSLYFTALVFDLIAVSLGLLISWQFAFMLFIYGLVSKAYSHPMIRLKKYPYISWLVAGFFQGCFTFIMAYMGLNEFGFFTFIKSHVLIPGLLSSLMLWGSYPMTQIYQHDEDASRGDHTLSLKLGIIGTFKFTSVVFLMVGIAFMLYFNQYYSYIYGLYFILFLIPVLLFFGQWFLRSLKNPQLANYSNTMWLNLLSGLCLSAFFIYFFLDSSQIGQVFD